MQTKHYVNHAKTMLQKYIGVLTTSCPTYTYTRCNTVDGD